MDRETGSAKQFSFSADIKTRLIYQRYVYIVQKRMVALALQQRTQMGTLSADRVRQKVKKKKKDEDRIVNGYELENGQPWYAGLGFQQIQTDPRYHYH